MDECKSLWPVGSYLYSVCKGEADLPIVKINAYRKRWGLSALNMVVVDHSPRQKAVRKSRPPVLKKRRTPKKTKTLSQDVLTKIENSGVSIEEVKKWLGRPCGCSTRHRKLKSLNSWAERTGGTEELREIMLNKKIKLPESPPPQVTHSPPPIARQVWNLARSLADFVQDGCTTVNEEQYEQRLLTCDGCEFRRKNRCMKCGCRLSLKAKGRAFKCPEDKWPSL